MMRAAQDTRGAAGSPRVPGDPRPFTRDIQRQGRPQASRAGHALLAAGARRTVVGRLPRRERVGVAPRRRRPAPEALALVGEEGDVLSLPPAGHGPVPLRAATAPQRSPGAPRRLSNAAPREIWLRLLRAVTRPRRPASRGRHRFHAHRAHRLLPSLRIVRNWPRTPAERRRKLPEVLQEHAAGARSRAREAADFGGLGQRQLLVLHQVRDDHGRGPRYAALAVHQHRAARALLVDEVAGEIQAREHRLAPVVLDRDSMVRQVVVKDLPAANRADSADTAPSQTLPVSGSMRIAQEETVAHADHCPGGPGLVSRQPQQLRLGAAGAGGGVREAPLLQQPAQVEPPLHCRPASAPRAGPAARVSAPRVGTPPTGTLADDPAKPTLPDVWARLRPNRGNVRPMPQKQKPGSESPLGCRREGAPQTRGLEGGLGQVATGP